MPPHSYHTIAELERKIDKAMDNSCDIHESDENIQVADKRSRVRSARADHRMATLNEIENIAGDADQREGRMKMHQERQRNSGVWGILHGASTSKQMLSFCFILILLLTALQMLRMNYFIATIRAQYLSHNRHLSWVKICLSHWIRFQIVPHFDLGPIAVAAGWSSSV